MFTCLTSKAIYYDLVISLSTEDFFNTMRKFISIYGRSETFNSDNGTNFVGAELLTQIRIMEETKEITEWTSRKSMTWKFHPPSAPPFGGAHVCLVRSTKLALYRASELKKKGIRL